VEVDPVIASSVPQSVGAPPRGVGCIDFTMPSGDYPRRIRRLVERQDSGTGRLPTHLRSKKRHGGGPKALGLQPFFQRNLIHAEGGRERRIPCYTSRRMRA